MRWVRLGTIPFTMLLPWLALAVWAVIVAVPAGRTYMALRQVERQGKSATVTAGAFHTTIPPEHFLPFAVNGAVVTRSHALTAMLLPGALVEMPIPVALTRPSLWYPKQLDEWTGTLLTMPVYCLPAWWLVGLGLEGLLGRRRVRWQLLALGSLLCVVFVFLLCGYLAGWTVQDHAMEGWVVAGLGWWAVLFAVLPAAWVRQARRAGGVAVGKMSR